jgi:hypothetical protein
LGAGDGEATMQEGKRGELGPGAGRQNARADGVYRDRRFV